MVRRLCVFVALAAVVFAGCGEKKRGGDAAGSRRGATAEEIYQQVAEARRDMETTEEKLAATKKFLSEHPESRATARALDAVLYYQGEALGDLEGAIAYAEGIRGGLTDPAVVDAVDKVMIPWYGRAKMTDNMTAVANRLEANGKLQFDDHYHVIESAVNMGDWALARTYCEKAFPLATAEACKRESPDRKVTDEEVEREAREREGMLLAMRGWARANQGELDAALVDLEKAQTLVPESYVGAKEHGVGVRHAKILMMKGRYEEAMERLAVEALVMREPEALSSLEQAYAALHADLSGFETYAEELHRRVAKTVRDFDLSGYDGVRRHLSDLRGDVTLLTFWFPT